MNVSIDQRKAARLDVSYPVTVRRPDSREEDQAGSLTNISQGGVCFVSTLKLRQGDRIEIDLPVAVPITLKFKVIWCRPQRDLNSTGAEYVDTSEARRARVLEMNQAIADYQAVNSGTISPQHAAIEWLSRYSLQFLSGAP